MSNLRYPILLERRLVKAAFLSGGIPAVRRLTSPLCSQAAAKDAVRRHRINEPGLGWSLYQSRRLPNKEIKRRVRLIERRKCLTCASVELQVSDRALGRFKSRHSGLFTEQTLKAISKNRRRRTHVHISAKTS